MLADTRVRGDFNERLRARGIPAKACASCLTVKSSLQFALYARTKLDGRRPSCRDCRSGRRAATAEGIRAQKRAYHTAHRDEVNAHRRSRYGDIADRERGRNRDWAAANSDKVRAKGQRRRAAIANATVQVFTADDVRRHWEELDLWDCFFCAGPLLDLEDEHFYPLAPVPGVPKGAHELENIVPACRTCNRSKGNRDPWIFLRACLDARAQAI